MKYFNVDVLSTLINENSLLDVTLESISIFEENYLVNVILEIGLRPKSEFKKIKLIFLNVEECGFSYEKNISFKTVADSKFFKTSDGYFYLSLDPFFGDRNKISDKDTNFVKSKKIEMIVV